MSTSKRIAELNEHYQFITIEVDNYTRTSADDLDGAAALTTINVRLSHTGCAAEDAYHTFDDLTLGQAIKRVHRAVYGHKIPDVDGVGSTQEKAQAHD